METTVAGDFSCEMWVNGEKIPKILEFEVGAGTICISKSLVAEPEVSSVAGETLCVALDARDRFGNVVSRARDLGELALKLKLPVWRQVEAGESPGEIDPT